MRRQELWKGVVAGSVAGLAGSLAMNQFQNVWSKASEKLKPNGNGESGNSSGQESEDATLKAAGKVAESAGYHLSHEQCCLQVRTKQRYRRSDFPEVRAKLPLPRTSTR